MYSVNAKDHFNCSPLLFSRPAPQNRCGQTERGVASGTLLVPRTRTATSQCSFAVNGPRSWNSLPADLRTPDTTLCSFKRHLKARFSSSLRCCWQVGSAPFIWRRCDCSESSVPITNIQTYLLTYCYKLSPVVTDYLLKYVDKNIMCVKKRPIFLTGLGFLQAIMS